MEPKTPNRNQKGTLAEVEAARAHARAYKEQEGGQPAAGDESASQSAPPNAATGPANNSAPRPTRPRSEEDWQDVVGQAIEEAMRKGEFDNLRGKGKPLPKNENPFTPPGSELAYDILKNNDLTPGWIGTRNEVQREIERWRAQLRSEVARSADAWLRAGADANARAAVRARWQSTRARQHESMDALNRRIRDVNLQQPISSMHLIMLRMAEEERRAGLPAELQ